MAENKLSFYENVAKNIIKALENGTASWVKPWKPGEISLPHNPITDRRYKGFNAIWLSQIGLERGYDDPRWMTFKQAQTVDARVLKGEKGTLVQYWKFSEEKPLLDERGKPVLDENKKPLTTIISLARPQVFSAVVFNAQQIEGLEPRKIIALDDKTLWENHQKCEQLLKHANINHASQDRAYYSPEQDTIFLPEKSQFPEANNYYATALHELGHWSGHKDRLNRLTRAEFGAEAYAKEELRAEIASYLMGDKLKIGHDPGQHHAYINSWIQVLKNDPREIFKASSDAEKIMDYLFSLELKKEVEMKQEVFTSKEAFISLKPQEKVYLNVPYKEKDDAKKLGARWDRQSKRWYVQDKDDLSALSKWLPTEKERTPAVVESPITQFKQALEKAGLIIEGEPVMDGKRQRVPVAGDKGTEKSGSYIGFLDNHPAGSIQNWKTGFKEKWRADGQALNTLSSAEKNLFQENITQNRLAREQQQEALYEKRAQECTKTWYSLKPADKDHPYLVKKDVFGNGLRQNEHGELVVPAKDANGKIWSLQRISEDGKKSFEKDARKAGCFYTLGHIKTSKEVLIAEGYATAATLYLATNKPVVVAFDSHNLKAVAQEVKKHYPNQEIFIMGDDDRHKLALGQKNVGRECAQEAAKAVSAHVVFPAFVHASSKLTDFNDLQREHGLTQVKKQLATVLAATEKQKQHALKQHQTLSQAL